MTANLPCTPETKARLLKHGGKDDTFDDILRRLLDNMEGKDAGRGPEAEGQARA